MGFMHIQKANQQANIWIGANGKETQLCRQGQFCIEDYKIVASGLVRRTNWRNGQPVDHVNYARMIPIVRNHGLRPTNLDDSGVRTARVV